LLSASLFTPLQKEISWGINSATFRLPLISLSSVVGLRRGISYLFSIRYIFRWIATIPLAMLIFYLT
jgi:hypothetical protein